MSKKSLLICVDIEPDLRELKQGCRADWEGFEALFELLQVFRPRFQEATGGPVHFTWFVRFDPQVEQVYGAIDWAARRYASLFRKLESAGDQLGLHTHTWQWDAGKERWVGNYADQAWVEKCIRRGLQAYGSSFGRSCPVFRHGDGYLNNATVALLDRLGVPVDMTLEPGREGKALSGELVGNMTDLCHAPRHAYHPAKMDFTRPGGWGRRRRIWMMPMTTVDFHNLDNFECVQGSAISTGNAVASYEGYLDRADDWQITGWAYDILRPNDPLVVDLFVDGRHEAALLAHWHRPDLEEAGKGNGRHGFYYHVPAKLRDGREHIVSARIADTSFPLSLSPRTLTLRQQVEKSYQTLNLAFSPSQVIAGFEEEIRNTDRHYITIITRSDVGIIKHRPSGPEVILEEILNHPRIAEVSFDTCDEAMRRMGIQ